MTYIDLEPVRAPVETLKWVKQRKAELKELEAAARTAVEEYMGDAEDGLLDGEPAIRWERHKRRSLDQRALKDDHPEIVEEYMTTSVVRRFEVVDDE